MPDIKNNHPDFPETRTALAEYVDSMLRVPGPEQQKSRATPEPGQTEAEAEQCEPRLVQFLKLSVDERFAYIPVEQIKSLANVREQGLLAQPQGPLLGSVNREGREIPLYDLGWIFTLDREGGLTPAVRHPRRSHAVILRGQHFALACDRIFDMSELSPEQIRESRDQRPNRRWIRGIAMDGMIPVINIPEIKGILRSRVLETGTIF